MPSNQPKLAAVRRGPSDPTRLLLSGGQPWPARPDAPRLPPHGGDSPERGGPDLRSFGNGSWTRPPEPRASPGPQTRPSRRGRRPGRLSPVPPSAAGDRGRPKAGVPSAAPAPLARSPYLRQRQLHRRRLLSRRRHRPSAKKTGTSSQPPPRPLRQASTKAPPPTPKPTGNCSRRRSSTDYDSQRAPRKEVDLDRARSEGGEGRSRG
ncbi:uncharacterized protein LOC141552267 [Sminthopsis crassicaudata]|uniref:uncharacterized protein LOC141552267 n=1 Tax=Sminthopsis crassicaudata TaxID=9301 RepID=UPI003D69F347